jgi:hypothetical protein
MSTIKLLIVHKCTKAKCCLIYNIFVFIIEVKWAKRESLWTTDERRKVQWRCIGKRTDRFQSTRKRKNRRKMIKKSQTRVCCQILKNGNHTSKNLFQRRIPNQLNRIKSVKRKSRKTMTTISWWKDWCKAKSPRSQQFQDSSQKIN